MRVGRRAYDFMRELVAIFPLWFYILLAVGIFDALLQWSDYREWRKEHRDSEVSD